MYGRALSQLGDGSLTRAAPEAMERKVADRADRAERIQKTQK
jgi:hypothetical protein